MKKIEKIYKCHCGKLGFSERCINCGETGYEIFYARLCARREQSFGPDPCDQIITETLSSPIGRLNAEATRSVACDWDLYLAE